MKNSSLSSSFASLVVLALARLAFAPPVLAAEPAFQEARDKFRSQFEQLAKIGSKDEMGRLVKANLDEAVFWVIEVAESISIAPNEKLYEQIKNLRVAWNLSESTDFVDKMEAYFSLLDANQKRERNKLKEQYTKASDRYFKAVQAPVNQTELGVLALEFEGMAGIFEQLGDKYYASQCWSFYGNCNDEFFRKDQADLYKACRGHGKVVETRDAIGLHDRVYVTTKPRYEALKGQGFAGERKQPGSEQPTTPEPGAGPAPASMVVPMSFQPVVEIDEVERPSYTLDDLYPVWNSIGLAAKGSSAVYDRIQGGVQFLRLGANQIQVDSDKDGKGDVDVPLTGNYEPVLFEIGQGEEKRKWGFLVTVGIQKDNYQGFDMNLAPQDESLVLYMAPAGSMSGMIGTTPIRVFDDNMDGIYGGPLLTFGYIGCSENMYAPDIDSIQVGTEKRARPWSEVISIGGSWYRLTSEKGGAAFSAKPETVKTGKLKLKYKGGKPSWLIVKGEGAYENCLYDLASGASVEVPAGKYSLYFGELRTGKKKQVLKAMMLPTSKTPGWSVEPGAETVVELGAPYSFVFKTTADAEKLTVLGTSVAVEGSAGELYQRVWGAIPRPEVSFRKKGGKKGSKPEKMHLVQTQEELVERGWISAWFPLDLVLERDGVEGDLEVQLFEKANKLFGKIESPWRE